MKNIRLFILTNFFLFLIIQPHEDNICNVCGNKTHTKKTSYDIITEKVNIIKTWFHHKVYAFPEKTKRLTVKTVAQGIVTSEKIIVRILEKIKSIFSQTKENIEKLSGWAHQEAA